MIGLFIALLIAVVAGGAAILFVGDDDTPVPTVQGGDMTDATGGTGTTGTTGTTGGGKATGSTPDKSRSVVTGHFNAPGGYSRGARLVFGAIWIDYPDDRCRVHTFATGERARGAYESDCTDWEGGGYDVLLFRVWFKNRSDRVVTLMLRNFVLESRDGRSFGPVNVRSEADFPTSFLEEKTKLPRPSRSADNVPYA